jgi:hypothetical protein
MNKRLLILLFITTALHDLQAQTPTDGLMMSKKSLCTGFLYTHDQWTNYWEGTLKRDNQNIGTITTQSTMWMGAYGITKKLNVIAMLPYVWTKASGGTLRGMEGIQDLSVALKYNLFRVDVKKSKLSAFAVGAFSAPLTNYTPDFLPLSIGLASKNIQYRVTANYTLAGGLYANASLGYTWRSNINLDRPSYYTDDQFFLTDEVKMSNVMDYIASVGYNKGALMAELFFTQQNTLGGGDIRRQDMPFPSNKMNFSKAGVVVMYKVSKIKNLSVRASAMQTLAGRNVGQSTTLSGGLLYIFNFSPASEETTNP